MNTTQRFLKKNEKFLGSIATVLGIIMFFSLFEIFFSNLKGDSTIVFQPLATAINGLVWSLYAYGRKDYYLLIPNVLAFFLGSLTVASAFV